jgi:hypothetical protein
VQDVPAGNVFAMGDAAALAENQMAYYASACALGKNDILIPALIMLLALFGSANTLPARSKLPSPGDRKEYYEHTRLEVEPSCEAVDAIRPSGMLCWPKAKSVICYRKFREH